jgi:hypothetical protein
VATDGDVGKDVRVALCEPVTLPMQIRYCRFFQRRVRLAELLG